MCVSTSLAEVSQTPAQSLQYQSSWSDRRLQAVGVDSFPLLPILCFLRFQSDPSWLGRFTIEVMEIIMHE